ncbi:unnamed protein product [Caenorhabditis auriculariae]|uniref:Fungal lipase-type domain-containing protein n=1 Tax=Caenorhabditis auriculariae TaxID=2777116 RepID=A0A8S1GNS7_9PELO|nr:unnamed protein product [Caenorhabditis auriculariae]
MRSLAVLVALTLVATSIQAPWMQEASYTDAFARSQMLPLAAAAYASAPQTCLTNKFTNAQLKRQITVKCDGFKGDDCSGYTAALHTEKAIVVSFRGTQGFLQLVSEADKSVFQFQSPWVAGGKVSKYFADGFLKVWNSGMKDDFIDLQSKNPGYQIWVTGHSLGGSMASLAASYIVNSKLAAGSNVYLVTYGQPRTGNKAFSSAHDSQFAYSYRVTHYRDVVPHIPNENFEGYYHHKSEVYYKNNMKSGASFTICTADEDSKCSDGLWITTSITDHLHYFNIDVSDYGAKRMQMNKKIKIFSE